MINALFVAGAITMWLLWPVTLWLAFGKKKHRTREDEDGGYFYNNCEYTKYLRLFLPASFLVLFLAIFFTALCVI